MSTRVAESAVAEDRSATWSEAALALDSGVPAAPSTAERERPLRRFARDLTRGAAVVVMLHLFVIQVSIVRGHSMEPSLHDGDRLVVDRLFAGLLGVDRFDVVVLRNPGKKDVDYVKRVVGLPGDHVRLARGVVLVNDEPLDPGYAYIQDTDDTGVYVVPPGHYFVLGDNRPISADSREFGLVDGELVLGRVCCRFWPLNRARLFD